MGWTRLELKLITRSQGNIASNRGGKSADRTTKLYVPAIRAHYTNEKMGGVGTALKLFSKRVCVKRSLGAQAEREKYHVTAGKAKPQRGGTTCSAAPAPGEPVSLCSVCAGADRAGGHPRTGSTKRYPSGQNQDFNRR